jgi:N utilization substance protein A
MAVTLSDEARQYIALFDEETDVQAVDCVIDEAYDRVAFVVPPGTMGQAIGPGGERVRAVESKIGRDVVVVEDADRPEDFVANALAPAAVYNVTVSENDTTVAYAEVDHEDHGVAIGKDGRRIELARRLATRHFDIDDIELT